LDDPQLGVQPGTIAGSTNTPFVPTIRRVLIGITRISMERGDYSWAAAWRRTIDQGRDRSDPGNCRGLRARVHVSGTGKQCATRSIFTASTATIAAL